MLKGQNTKQIQKIVSLLFATGRSIRERICQKMGHGALSFLQFQTLRFIATHPHVSMKQIADYLFITPASTTSLVQSLVDSDVVKRTNEVHDRRSILLQITPRGTNVLEKRIVQSADRLKDMLIILTKEEQKQLIHILQKIVNIV